MKKIILVLLARLRGGVWLARKLGVSVGEGCRIYTRQFGSEPFLVTIGKRVTVTSGVQFITHDGSTWLIRDVKGRRFRFAPISIGDDVFVGVNSIILPGVRIGSRCIIGAGSVVTRSVPEGSVAVGVPAKVIGTFDQFEAKALRFYVSERDVIPRDSVDYRTWVLSCLEAQKEFNYAE
ncbi:acyltransferase [Rhodanobacter sp. IGA1.0]|uniref:Acyltransferase n=1 Tax=Rhodanobacter sp. IGA1.0 TaxID=3158582 RepID=A0AAU7QM55_9GAMM